MSSESTVAIGGLFRVIRLTGHQSLRRISHTTQLPASRISEIERGLRTPTLEEAVKLWAALAPTAANGRGAKAVSG